MDVDVDTYGCRYMHTRCLVGGSMGEEIANINNYTLSLRHICSSRAMTE